MATIRTYLEKYAGETPSNVALVYCAAKVWHERTYADFLKGVRVTAEAYGTRFKIRPREEHAAILLPNGPDWLETYLALSGAGVPVVPLDPKLHNEEVEYILRDSGAVVVTTDYDHLQMMRDIVPHLPGVRAVIIANPKGALDAKIGEVPVFEYAALANDVKPEACGWYDDNVAREEDVASIIYTSGTTGKPKGAMLTHGNFIADATGGLAAFNGECGPKDRFCIILPLFHAFSFCANFVVPLVTGAQMSFVRSLYTIGEDVKNLHPTVVMAVPLLAEKIYDRIEASLKKSKKAQFFLKWGLGFLVFRKVREGLGGKLRFMVVGGAPCPKHIIEGWRKIGIIVLEGYGLTECSPIVSISGPKTAKTGTIGEKLANIEVRLADRNEQGIGELQVKGPITMKGYWHNDAATAETFDGEWLKTGDLASIDELGLITIRGRKKALIVNREGKNIYPEEIENRIAGDQTVADCVVIGYTTGGIPGEKVGCIVCPNVDMLTAENGGVPMSWDEMEKIAIRRVHARCQDLADYKRVRKVVVKREPLERTSIQKVRRVTYKGTLDE